MTVAEEGLPAEGTVAEGAAAGVAVAPQRRATSFAGDVLKLVSGTTLAQAIGVLITPVLTRLYAPEAFGTLALFTSMTGIIGVIACLRYELAIMLPENDEEAANLLAVSLLATVAVTALTIPVITLGRPLLLRLLKAPELGPYLWLVPMAVFFAGVFQALNYWNSRTKHFGRLSVVRVVNSGVTYAAKLGAGLVGYLGGGSLIGATLLGSALSTTELGRRIWQDDGAELRRCVSIDRIWRCSGRYRKFPFIDSWGALLNTVSWQLPALMLNYFFSATVVGHYSLGLRMLQLPMSLVGGAIGQVYFQRAAEAKARGELGPVVRNTLERLTAIGLFPMLVLGTTGPEVFAFVFGGEWGEAGRYAQVLSVWTFFWFLSSPISTTISVLEKQSFGLACSTAILMTRFVALWIGGTAQDPVLALGLYAISGAILYGLVVLRLVSWCGVTPTECLAMLRPLALRFASAITILGGLKLLRAPDWLVVVAAATVLMAYYGVELWRTPHVRAALGRYNMVAPRVEKDAHS